MITFLEDIYTPFEKTLISGGHEQLVIDCRFAFQQMMRDNYIGIIENVTGRKVRAFLSQNHIDPAIATEIFVLEPEERRRHLRRSALRRLVARRPDRRVISSSGLAFGTVWIVSGRARPRFSGCCRRIHRALTTECLLGLHRWATCWTDHRSKRRL